jgi:hypothetical protein
LRARSGAFGGVSDHGSARCGKPAFEQTRDLLILERAKIDGEELTLVAHLLAETRVAAGDHRANMALAQSRQGASDGGARALAKAHRRDLVQPVE